MQEWRLEPLYGVWLTAEQVKAIYVWRHPDEMLTITDLRDKSVELNLPDCLKDSISDYRGSVLVEQQDKYGNVARMAIVDRYGRRHPLALNEVRALNQDEQLQQLVKLATAVLSEIDGLVDEIDTARTLARCLDVWDEFVNNIESEEGTDGD